MGPSEVAKNKMQFEWKSFELDGRGYEHGAMLLPVHLETIGRTFQMQLDLGLDLSTIYENPLKTLLAEYPYLKGNVIVRNDYEVIKINKRIGNYSSSVDSLLIYKEYGEAGDFESLNLIGSIGANEVENKILRIDFPNKTMSIFDSEDELDRANYHLIHSVVR